MRHGQLRIEIDDYLLSHVTPKLRASLDWLLAQGITRDEVLASVQQMSMHRGGGLSATIVLGVAAYLESTSTDGWEGVIP